MLFHILKDLHTWEGFLKKGTYTPPSYSQEGFIHLCRAEQVLEVIHRHFPEEEELILLMIPQKRIKEHVVWEETGHGVFPHLYAPLSLTEIESTAYLIKSPDQQFFVLMEDGREVPLLSFLNRFFSRKNYKDGFRFPKA